MPRVAAAAGDDDPSAPVSVNYFPSRECNYACGFCFHTNTSGYILPLGEAKRGLRLLAGAGMRKLNIAGGEPFLHPAFLGEILRYSKDVLGLESVSVISNGSKIREGFLREYGRYLDILAVSCDSFVSETNRAIGRGENGQADGGHVAQVFRMRFLDKGDGPMKKSDPLLDVGVRKAMQQVAWDKEAFNKRGGIYEWRKPQVAGSAEAGCGGSNQELEW